MTREQIITIFTDLGIEAPQKGVVTSLLNAFNQEKGQEVENAKKTATDEAVAKYKDYVKPEDHKKVVDELNAEKGKGALAERKAKYKEVNLNVDDEDVFNLIDTKLKDSKDFDKDLAEYVKAHPSFVKAAEKKEKQQSNGTKVTIGGAASDKGASKEVSYNLGEAISEAYSENK